MTVPVISVLRKKYPNTKITILTTVFFSELFNQIPNINFLFFENKHKNILEGQLKKDKISIISKPIRATYNSPFTLPMLRRNEVMFKIETNT